MSWKVFVVLIFLFAGVNWAFPGASEYIFFGSLGTILFMAVVAGLGQEFGYWP